MWLTNDTLIIILYLHILQFLVALCSEFVHCSADKLFAPGNSSSSLTANQLQNGTMQIGLPLFILSGLQNGYGSQTVGFAYNIT